MKIEFDEDGAKGFLKCLGITLAAAILICLLFWLFTLCPILIIVAALLGMFIESAFKFRK